MWKNRSRGIEVSLRFPHECPGLASEVRMVGCPQRQRCLQTEVDDIGGAFLQQVETRARPLLREGPEPYSVTRVIHGSLSDFHYKVFPILDLSAHTLAQNKFLSRRCVHVTHLADTVTAESPRQMDRQTQMPVLHLQQPGLPRQQAATFAAYEEEKMVLICGFRSTGCFCTEP